MSLGLQVRLIDGQYVSSGRLEDTDIQVQLVGGHEHHWVLYDELTVITNDGTLPFPAAWQRAQTRSKRTRAAEVFRRFSVFMTPAGEAKVRRRGEKTPAFGGRAAQKAEGEAKRRAQQREQHEIAALLNETDDEDDDDEDDDDDDDKDALAAALLKQKQSAYREQHPGVTKLTQKESFRLLEKAGAKGKGKGVGKRRTSSSSSASSGGSRHASAGDDARYLAFMEGKGVPRRMRRALLRMLRHREKPKGLAQAAVIKRFKAAVDAAAGGGAAVSVEAEVLRIYRAHAAALDAAARLARAKTAEAEAGARLMMDYCADVVTAFSPGSMGSTGTVDAGGGGSAAAPLEGPRSGTKRKAGDSLDGDGGDGGDGGDSDDDGAPRPQEEAPPKKQKTGLQSFAERQHTYRHLWEQLWSRSRRRTYYFNPKLGKSWDPPPGTRWAAEAGGNDSDDDNIVDSQVAAELLAND